MSASPAQPLDADDIMTVNRYGVEALSDLQLRIAHNSEVQYNVHKAILAHHSLFFEHLLVADPQLKEIELVSNLPVTVDEISLFLQTIYGERGCYLQGFHNYSRKPPTFFLHQAVRWEGANFYVSAAHEPGKLVSLKSTYQPSRNVDVDAYELYQQNLTLSAAQFTATCELAAKLLPASVYFEAEYLLNECVSVVRTHFASMTAQQKVQWLAKFDELKNVEVFTELLKNVTVAELQQAEAAGMQWATTFRTETLGKILHKTLAPQSPAPQTAATNTGGFAF